MRILVTFFICLFVLVGCSSPPTTERSALAKIKIRSGMSRAEVEKLVAEALSLKSSYSPYNSNLSGGRFVYVDGNTVLEVIYQAGAPAPWILSDHGVAEHSPPRDEIVGSSRLYLKDGR